MLLNFVGTSHCGSVQPVPLLSHLPAALKWQVSLRHAAHTKQAAATVLTNERYETHTFVDGSETVGRSGTVFIQRMPHSCVLVH